MLATKIDPVCGARLFMVFALTKILKFLRRAYTQESAFVTDNHTLRRRLTVCCLSSCRYRNPRRLPLSLGCHITADPLHDPFSRVTVAIRVFGGGHGPIGSLVREQPHSVLDDCLGIRAGQKRGASSHALWALGRVAHHEDRLAQ